MARTQLRPDQITGSFGDVPNGIHDGRAAGSATLGSITMQSGSLVGVLSEVVSSVKRLHGAGSFAANAAGEFSQSITPNADDGAALGSSSKNWSDLFLADGAVINLGDDQDVTLTHVADNGILLNSTRYLGFNDAGTAISSPADGKLLLSSDGALDDAIEIKTTNAAGEIVIESAHTAGVAVHIDADAAAGSILDIDAGILQIDATGAAGINSGGTLSLGTANSGVAVSIGHTTSEVTVNDNLTVTGDFTVNGTTTTLDTTNLLVEDPIIVLNKANGSANGQGGIAIELGGSSLDMVFGRVANDTWGVGTKDTSGGTVTTLADMTLGTFRSSKLEIDGDSDHIDVTTSNLTATAGASFKVDAEEHIILDSKTGQVKFFDEANDFGLIAMSGDSGLTLSSSAGNDVALDSQSGYIGFQQKGIASSPAFGAINVDTANEVFFGHWDPTGPSKAVPGNIKLVKNAASVLSASTGLAIKAGATTSALQLFDAGESHYLAFDAPALGANVTYTFPALAGAGNAGKFLKTDADGDLSWDTVLGIPSKGTKVITSTANTANFNSVDDGATLSGLSNASQAVLDVYVNGQLMSSGSVEQVETNGVRDYRVSADTILRFAFNLEADDVVVAIKRA